MFENRSFVDIPNTREFFKKRERKRKEIKNKYYSMRILFILTPPEFCYFAIPKVC
jgi:hypothetical protein